MLLTHNDSLKINLANSLSEINSNLIKVVESETVNFTIAANGVNRTNVKYTCPDGYTPILAAAMSNAWQINAMAAAFTNSYVVINYSTNFLSESTASVYAKILCVKI